MLAEIAQSDEIWKLSVGSHATALVRSLYLGLLEREPDPAALKANVERLAIDPDLAPLLTGIARSDELWRALFKARAPEMVGAVVRGLFNRAPHPEELRQHVANVIETGDMAATVSMLAHSDDMWNRLFAARAPRFVEAIYRNVLGREADPSGLSSYSDLMAEPLGFNKVLARIVNSPEFEKSRQKAAVVFLHIHKTGGTSIQGMLQDAHDKPIYLEHGDSLGSRTPKELSDYSVFAGHFNFDSLGHIPWRRLSVFTFVREPRERLTSHYHFLRAHEPTAPDWTSEMKAANEMLLGEFLERESAKTNSSLWNHMTWAIMGQRQWDAWRQMLNHATKEEAVAFIAGTVRPAICRRLREFAFVGLQEDFERSVAMGFNILKLPNFKTIRKDHGVDQLMQTNRHFKKHLNRQPVVGNAKALLEEFVQLDSVVYEESKQLYAERTAEFGQGTRSSVGEVNKVGSATFSTVDLQEEKLVFLHLPKTGGTTLHNLFLPHFDEKRVCPERFNGLRHYVCGELVRYRYFSGHFDLASVNLIPGRKQIVTMLREPVSRLISLYYFARAHRTDVIERQNLDIARMANKCTMAEFFRAEEIRAHPGVNNALTRVLTQVVGGKRWEQKSGAAPATDNAIDMLPQALEELKAFTAFGIMEQYDLSVELIFRAIGMAIPASIEKRQVLDVIVEREPGLRKITKEAVTEEIRELITRLVDADIQLYRRAREIFETRARALREASNQHG
jgi:hypothetical protein